MRRPLLVRRVQGRSMLPALRPGQIVFAYGWFRYLNVGNTVILLHDGSEKIKRISWINKGKLEVLGDNPVMSTDSRHFGSISKELVIAKVLYPRTKN